MFNWLSKERMSSFSLDQGFKSEKCFNIGQICESYPVLHLEIKKWRWHHHDDNDHRDDDDHSDDNDNDDDDDDDDDNDDDDDDDNE